MTYYDRLNAFFLENEIEPLPPSAQLLYLHLLHENNRLQNPRRFRLSDSRLAAMTGLSRQTIATAKRALTNRELLEIIVDSPRKSTLYILPATVSDGRQAEITGVSREIKAAWQQNNNGTPPNETEIFYLTDDVKLHGEEAVKRAIERAGQKKRGDLSIYFYRMILNDVLSGKAVKTNGRRNEQYRIDADSAPEY